ncbi:MAG TPA: methylated-DNA--[protein]-cysteine S-methyltransferase [Cerasibacillus sp.]|uniref:methylated-DNA--[protein]-cysteine S-methyltransferase n=1 Tax=Cerasibacillus sp. TaxID=2498711 RepID=UPI002F3F3906
MKQTTLYYAEIDTPVGPMLIMNDGNTVLRIDYGTFEELELQLQNWTERYVNNAVFLNYPETCHEVIEQLNEYFSGERLAFSFEWQVHGTPFQKQVWETLVKEVAYGQTKSYHDIAKMIGRPQGSRAVGRALNKNPLSIVIPCHRVVGKSGKLVGYDSGLEKKRFLLQHEQKKLKKI